MPGAEVIEWCEVGDVPSTERFTSLSEVIREAGVENNWTFLPVGTEGEAKLSVADGYKYIRLSGSACQEAIRFSVHAPSQIISLGAADALVAESNNVRWPRCFFTDAVARTLAQLNLDLDFSGGVFVLGATPEARWMIASLARLGFSRVSISDPDEAKCQLMVDEMRRSTFGVQFQNVPRQLLTQLPGVHPIAINTLAKGLDGGALEELFYFNFLKPGGAWIDLALLPYNSALEAEAESVGAQVIQGHRIIALADVLWAKSVLGVTLELDALAANLASRTGRS